MPKRRDPQKPNDERVRFMGGRAPDTRAEETSQPDALVPDLHTLQSRTDPLGRCRITVGFELVSCAIPTRVQLKDNPGNDLLRFPGERELAADTQVALAPFVAEMLEGAALIAEYAFSPAGEGSAAIRFRLLFETPPMPVSDALEEALSARDELGVCLRVLAAWYAVVPVQFRPEDRTRWLGKKVRLRAQPRLFMGGGKIGFVQQGRKPAAVQLLLPQPASGDVHLRQSRSGYLPLLLEGAPRSCLSATIRAARGLTAPLAIRVGLRRRNFEPAVVQAMEALTSNGLSAAVHGESTDVEQMNGTGRARDAAKEAVDQLVIQPESVELFVESDGTRSQSLALLRILGRELIPDFAAEVTESIPHGPKGSPGRAASSTAFDLSQLFVPGGAIPPLLPSPAELEALSFPRHFPNPTVVFPASGLHLGRAQIGGVVLDVRTSHVDRSRHTYVLGATGTGKSTLLYNMAVQDMHAGQGLCVLDPHGDLYEQLLLAVPPERKADLLLIDPEDDRFCPGLNPLDFGGKPNLEGVSRVANDMLDIFGGLYDMRQSGGPGFEDYFRNSMLLAAAAPKGGPNESDGPVPSLASITHVLQDSDWRDYCLSKLDSVYGKEEAEQVHRFFKMASRTTGEQNFSNWVPYISSKLTRFVTNATLRKLFCKGRRTLDLRSAMDQRKIVLVNLGKGDLGSSDSRIIGMLLTKYVFQAALSRSDIPRDLRVPFYFYLDEFQNFVATDIPEMLAESRKYGLYMVLANQTLGQLMHAGRRDTLDAVLGNVATKLFLRVGMEEAGAVAAGFAPYFNAETLSQLPDRHVLCRLQMRGQPSLPFVFETLAPMPLPPKATLPRSKEWAREAQPLASGSRGEAHVKAPAASATGPASEPGKQVSGDIANGRASEEPLAAGRAEAGIAEVEAILRKAISRGPEPENADTSTEAGKIAASASSSPMSADTLQWAASVARFTAIPARQDGSPPEQA